MPVVFQTGIPAEQLWGWPAGSPWNRAELQRDAPGADARDSLWGGEYAVFISRSRSKPRE